MNITGYQIRERIRVVDLRLKALYRQFSEGQIAFEGEDKPKPAQLDEKILRYERTEAQLQVIQAQYNLAVRVGKEPLHFAVKHIGALGRREKLWRELAAPKTDRYNPYGATERDPSRQYAKPTVTKEDAMAMALKTAREAGDLRAAINVANGTQINLEFDPALFED